jgi:Histidine kinase-like ATPase domain
VDEGFGLPEGHRRAFPNVPASAPEVRVFLRGVLADLGGEVDLDAALLLATELVGNTVLHTTVPDFEIQVTLSPNGVRIGVHDDDPNWPVFRAPDLLDTDGRGLPLVQTMSRAWGVDDRGAGGKLVWFALDRSQGPTPTRSCRAAST